MKRSVRDGERQRIQIKMWGFFCRAAAATCIKEDIVIGHLLEHTTFLLQRRYKALPSSLTFSFFFRGNTCPRVLLMALYSYKMFRHQRVRHSRPVQLNRRSLDEQDTLAAHRRADNLGLDTSICTAELRSGLKRRSLRHDNGGKCLVCRGSDRNI